MSARRPRRRLRWSLALAERSLAAGLPEIREERLFTLCGARGLPPVALSAWRGRSGKRYVVSVHTLTASAELSAEGKVAIAVRRDADGVGTILATGCLLWLRLWGFRLVRDGVNEIHLYHLADTAGERFAAIEDLREAG